MEHNRKLIASPNVKSAIRILEHPKDNVQYILGVDSVMSTDDTASGKGNSKFALVVMKGVDPQSELQFAPVASFKERPKDFDATFDTAIRILRYYNQFGKAQITGELNATGGVLCQKIQKIPELAATVMARKDHKKSGWVDTTKPWFQRVDAIKDWQYMYANTYFKKYAHMVHFIDLLYDAQKREEENKDLLDAFLACLYGFGSGDILGEKQPDARKYTMDVMIGRDSDGKALYERRTYSYDRTR